MAYPLLSKLFYASRETYEQTYQARYSSESALRFNISIGEFPAFLLVTPEIAAYIADIMEENYKVHQLQAALPESALAQYIRSCLVDEIRLTNDIEGVVSTRQDIYAVIENLPTSDAARVRVEGLVQNYLLMAEKNSNLQFRTCEDIRRLYDRLILEAVIAEDPKDAPDGTYFRKNTVSIQDGRQNIIHRGLYPEEKIIDAMNQALDIFNDSSLPVLLRIPVFHYLFGYIHPFYNGNGRMNRFISSYALFNNLGPLIGLRLSVSIKKNTDAYYKAFKVTNNPLNRGDLTPFVLSFLEILRSSAQKLEESLSGKKIRLQQYQQVCLSLLQGEASESSPDFRILDALVQASLFSHEGMDISSLAAAAKMSQANLRGRLKSLESTGAVLVDKRHRTHQYSANLKLMDEIMQGHGPTGSE